MFGDKPVTFTLVAQTVIGYGTVVQQSGTSGREQLGWQATSINQVLAGVAMADVNTGDQVGVCLVGRARCVAGAAVTQGVRVTTNSVGRLVAAASGSPYIGMALEAAAANGDTFECLINVSGDKVIA